MLGLRPKVPVEVCLSKGTNISLTPKEERGKGKNIMTWENQIVTLHQETTGVQTCSSRLLFKQSPRPKKLLIQRPNWLYSRRHEENKAKKQGTDFFGIADLLERK